MDNLCDDLIEHIIRGNVGVFTFVHLSAVCKRLRFVCRSYESLLVAAALYTGGLTRTQFSGLFALTPQECRMFNYTKIPRAWGVGFYCLYDTDAVAHAMRVIEGIIGWQSRVAVRGARALRQMNHRPINATPGKRKQWQLEEDLHRQFEHRHRRLQYLAS